MISLPELPRPIYFVCKNRDRWADLIDGETEVDISQLHHRFRDARESWVVQPYLQLKQRGVNVCLTDHFVPGEICIVSYEELRISDFPVSSFVVCCRHDRGVPKICNQRIVQNHLNVQEAVDHFLPHWPQPFIEPRNPSRGERLETIAYKGRESNLALPFRETEFKEGLQKMGVSLLVSPTEEASRVRDSRDYSEVDLVLAVRDCTEYNLSIKPPSKLINAWIAGCPAILGPEPAYQALRKHPLDFYEIRSVDEALEYIRILKEHPKLYSESQARCAVRAKEFMPDEVAKQWRDLLAGRIYDAYVLWRGGSLWKKGARIASFISNSIKHRKEKKIFYKNVHEGRRYFSKGKG